MIRSASFALFLSVLLLACKSEPPPGLSLQPGAEVEAAPPPSSDGRAWRRMNIDQLNNSLRAVSGGIAWDEESSGGETVDLFEQLAGSLGKPDYLNSNVEDLDPGLLFQKFLDDAASTVCSRWVERERGQSQGERLLLVHVEFADTPASAPDKVEANMRQALLRFHGRPIIEGDPTVDPWLTLLDNVFESTGDMGAAWRTACVALFTHPDFYTF